MAAPVMTGGSSTPACPVGARMGGGRYVVRGLLGTGGTAAVYRVHDERLEVERAIKVLSPMFARIPSVRARFEAEARTMARLAHPNIVAVHDIEEENGFVFIVMELAAESLCDRLQREGALEPREAIRVLRAVIAAVEAAHGAGVVHRDLKPENVLLGLRGEVKVGDFGIAHLGAREEASRLTQAGTPLGTIGFMAPEQRAGALDPDARADVFSLGALLYTLLTAWQPGELFVAELDPEILEGLPSALVPVVARATRYRREDRFPSAHALAEALMDAASKLGPCAEGLAPPVPPPGLVPILPDHPPADTLAPFAPSPMAPAEDVPKPTPPVAEEAPRTVCPDSIVVIDGCPPRRDSAPERSDGPILRDLPRYLAAGTSLGTRLEAAPAEPALAPSPVRIEPRPVRTRRRTDDTPKAPEPEQRSTGRWLPATSAPWTRSARDGLVLALAASLVVVAGGVLLGLGREEAPAQLQAEPVPSRAVHSFVGTGATAATAFAATGLASPGEFGSILFEGPSKEDEPGRSILEESVCAAGTVWAGEAAGRPFRLAVLSVDGLAVTAEASGRAAGGWRTTALSGTCDDGTLTLAERSPDGIRLVVRRSDAGLAGTLTQGGGSGTVALGVAW